MHSVAMHSKKIQIVFIYSVNLDKLRRILTRLRRVRDLGYWITMRIKIQVSYIDMSDSFIHCFLRILLGIHVQLQMSHIALVNRFSHTESFGFMGTVEVIRNPDM